MIALEDAVPPGAAYRRRTDRQCERQSKHCPKNQDYKTTCFPTCPLHTGSAGIIIVIITVVTVIVIVIICIIMRMRMRMKMMIIITIIIRMTQTMTDSPAGSN
eukprot:COSAG01_NODE_39465_length_476_cov_0.671088_1_plen_102_part_10